MDDKILLKINTTEIEKVSVSLITKDKTYEEVIKQKFGSQVLLNLIEKLLKDAKLTFKDLRKIEVATGPGSYTGIKVGVAVANALAFTLKIPVNGKKIETEIVY